MKQNETNLVQKCSEKFHCELCHYNTCRKSQYERHLVTDKHKNRTNETLETETKQKSSEKFQCLCGTPFKSRTTLWRHKKNCNATHINNHADIETDTDLDEDNITIDNFQDLTDKQMMMFILKQNMNLIKENSEFKSMMLEQQNIMMEVIKNGTHNTNSHNTTNNKNKTFNLNFFLNEQCKDAMNKHFILEIMINGKKIMKKKIKSKNNQRCCIQKYRTNITMDRETSWLQRPTIKKE